MKQSLALLISLMMILPAGAASTTQRSTPAKPAKPTKPAIDPLFCPLCTLLTSSQDPFTYEDPATCVGKDEEGKPFNRNYNVNLLKQVPAMYRMARASVPEANFPKECISYIMKSFSSKSFIYAKCDSATAKPESGAGKHCMTSDYVNSVYNSFVDVMDCLDVNQMIFLPKLLNESGFHINAFNSKGFDSGIGQLTKNALLDVNDNGHSKYFRKLLVSEKPSCQRLLKVSGLQNKVNGTSEKRCEIILAPANPIRNLLYTGMTALRLKEIVTSSLRKADIETLFKQAGFPNYDREKLLETLSIMGYNAGGGTAVRFLKDYLQTRIDKIKLGQGRPVSARDFDFSMNVDRDLEIRSALNLEYRTANTEAKADIEKKGIALDTPAADAIVASYMNSAHKKQMKKLEADGIHNVTFPIYAMYAQTVGAYGYGTLIAANKKRLDQNLGVGKCAPKQFLAF